MSDPYERRARHCQKTPSIRSWHHFRASCTEIGGGVVLLLAAIAALVIANSGYGPNFDTWQTTVGFRIGDTVWDQLLQ